VEDLVATVAERLAAYPDQWTPEQRTDLCAAIRETLQSAADKLQPAAQRERLRESFRQLIDERSRSRTPYKGVAFDGLRLTVQWLLREYLARPTLTEEEQTRLDAQIRHAGELWVRHYAQTCQVAGLPALDFAPPADQALTPERFEAELRRQSWNVFNFVLKAPLSDEQVAQWDQQVAEASRTALSTLTEQMKGLDPALSAADRQAVVQAKAMACLRAVAQALQGFLAAQSQREPPDELKALWPRIREQRRAEIEAEQEQRLDRLLAPYVQDVYGPWVEAEDATLFLWQCLLEVAAACGVGGEPLF